MKITDVEAFYVRLPEVKEQCDSGQDVLDFLTHQKIRAREGFLGIPQEPGLGIELDEEALRKYRVN